MCEIIMKFKTIISTALSIRTENIDTDQIIPAQFLKTTKKEGLGKFLFYNWRNDSFGKKRKAILNPSSPAQILIAGNNFGCGSSREHAVWALSDFGFKVIISSSFGDIFYSNSLKNGLLPVVLTPKELDILFKLVEKNPMTKITIDLENQKISASSWGVQKGTTPGSLPDSGQDGCQTVTRQARMTFHFPIDAFQKTCLLNGVDEFDYILSHEKEIREFEEKISSRIFLNKMIHKNKKL